MRAVVWIFRLVVIGGFLAIPTALILDAAQRNADERAFRNQYGSQVQQMNAAIQQLHRLQAEAAREKAEIQRAQKEVSR